MKNNPDYIPQDEHLDYDEPGTPVTPFLRNKIQDICGRLGSLFQEMADTPGASKKEIDGWKSQNAEPGPNRCQ